MTDEEMAETLDSSVFAETLAGIDGVDVDSKGLHKMLDEFQEAHEQDGASVDEFLQYLLGQGVINESIYRRANSLVSVTLGSISLENLPKSETVYDVRGTIGQGGMGEIRVGRDRHLDRRVALKFLRPDRVNDRIVSRFIQEAQVTAKLEHPNIIPVYSFHGEEDGRLSFSMKLVTGRDLEKLIADLRVEVLRGGEEQASISLDQRLDLFLSVCDAMSYAHDKGVLHRDLKPANLMVGEFNEIYVMDWGLAKIRGEESVKDELWNEQLDRREQLDESAQTRVGSVLGTPMYMPPEQARGEMHDLDLRADLYSLGIILFELVTLKRRFDGTKLKELMKQVVAGDTQDVSHIDRKTKVAPPLVAIIEKATAVDRENRYENVQALADDIRRFRNNRETSALPDSGLRALTRWMSHHRTATLGLILGLLLISALSVIGSLVQQNRLVVEHQHTTEQLSAFHSKVTSRAMKIDALGTGVLMLADQLAQSTSYLVRNGVEKDTKFYSNKDFASPETAPPDFKNQPIYKMSVSLEHPVYKLAPGVPLESVEPVLKRLTPLHAGFQRGFLRSTLDLDHKLDLNSLIGVKGAPIRWAYIGLESGLFFSYPGKGGYPDNYDPRERPWYKHGKTLKGAGACAKPYVDSQGQGLVLPCVSAIHGPDGELLGVAGYEVAFDFFLDNIMLADAPTHTAYLVDLGGSVIIQSGQKQTYERGKLHEEMVRPMFPNERIRKTVMAKRSGGFVLVEGNVKVAYTIVQLPTRSAAYVERALLSDILKWEDSD